MTASGEEADARIAQEAADWFARLRGEPSEADRTAFEQWRTADPAHAQAFERVALRWEQATFIRNTATVRSRDLSRAGRRFPMPGRMLAGSAAAAAVLALFVLTSLGGPDPAARSVPYANSAASPRTIGLADGSRVMLDGGAAVAVRFTADERRLILERGRARFFVQRDAVRPFVVAAGGGSVTAHGTVFDVARESAQVRVTLLEGSVTVAAVGPDKAVGARTLRPGQQTVYGSDGKPAAPAPAGRSDWAEAMLTFENTRLDEAAAAVGRGAQTGVAIIGPAAQLRISGAFRKGDPEAFAEAAAAMFGLEAARSGRTILLTKKP